MPKTTFFNISPQKQAKVIEAALDEFSKYSYAQASVNRVIQQAGIATGSFYQYFQDLDDLYIYIMTYCAQQKLVFIQAAFSDLVDDSFQQKLKALYIGGIKYALSDPRLFLIGNRLLEIKDSPLFQQITNQIDDSSIVNYVLDLINTAIRQHELRHDLDPQLIIQLIQNVNMTLIDYLLATKSPSDRSLKKEDYDTLAEMAVDILLSGLSNK